MARVEVPTRVMLILDNCLTQVEAKDEGELGLATLIAPPTITSHRAVRQPGLPGQLMKSFNK
jgi:hypothetical protein